MSIDKDNAPICPHGQNYELQARQTESPSPLNVGKIADESGSNPDSPLLKEQSKKSNDGGVEDISADFPQGPNSQTQGTTSGLHLSTPKCEICKVNKLGLYCTQNVCEECCKAKKCPLEDRCESKKVLK